MEQTSAGDCSYMKTGSRSIMVKEMVEQGNGGSPHGPPMLIIDFI